MRLHNHKHTRKLNTEEEAAFRLASSFVYCRVAGYMPPISFAALYYSCANPIRHMNVTAKDNILPSETAHSQQYPLPLASAFD